VLTDYHVHLRPDGPEFAAAEYLTAAKAAEYRRAAAAAGIGELGVSEHVYRFAQVLTVWDHPFWRAQAVDDIDAYCEFVRGETDLKLGIEADFVPGAEDRTEELLAARDFDYVVGSVHFIRDGAVDMDDYSVWSSGRPVEEIWARYFQTIGDAARSGLFDILAHPDLVKYWGQEGRRPAGDLRRYYEPAIAGIAESGIAVELSTAGLRKPVAELYPAREFLALAVAAGAPVALSSDAHESGHLGYRYDAALAELESLGVGEIAVFDRRGRSLAPLGTDAGP